MRFSEGAVLEFDLWLIAQITLGCVVLMISALSFIGRHDDYCLVWTLNVGSCIAMVKLSDIPDYERDHLMSKLLPPLGALPWVVNNKPLSEKKVAIITTAGTQFSRGP